MGHQEMTEARLRELYQLALASRDGGARERCVSPEAMLALVRREGPEEARLATLDHAMSCDACRRELDVLRAIELAGEQSGVAPERAHARSSPSWRRVVPLAIAASLLVAVGLGVRDRGRGRPVDDVSRGASDGPALVAPAAGDLATSAPIVFVWHSEPGASRYVLEVLAGGRVVVSETTADTTLALGDVSRLTADSAYVWWVRAVGDGGAQRGSEVRALRLRSR
jgi:hypothetical protein